MLADRIRVIAEGVGRCEGPVWRPDGTLVVTSMTHGRLYRVAPDGVTALAETGGEPNGLAIGADGSMYVAQAGARDPAHRTPAGIQRVESRRHRRMGH